MQKKRLALGPYLFAQSIYDLHTLAENFENVGERFNQKVDRRNSTFAMLND
jgi:hypothetical protein